MKKLTYFAVHLKSTKEKENNQNEKDFKNGKYLLKKRNRWLMKTSLSTNWESLD